MLRSNRAPGIRRPISGARSGCTVVRRSCACGPEDGSPARIQRDSFTGVCDFTHVAQLVSPGAYPAVALWCFAAAMVGGDEGAVGARPVLGHHPHYGLLVFAEFFG